MGDLHHMWDLCQISGLVYATAEYDMIREESYGD